MKDKKYQDYLTSLITLLKARAREAKSAADDPKTGCSSYNNGYLMGYHIAISLMKNQALAFNIDENEIGLADIEPERDLL